MILAFTAIDKETGFRSFSCYLSALEDASDILSIISTKGSTLLSAEIIDDGKQTTLPITAFDGEDFSTALKQLQLQWEVALSTPTYRIKKQNSSYAELTKQRLQLYFDRIAQLIKTRDQFEQLRLRTEITIDDINRKDKLLQYYSSHIAYYQSLIDKSMREQQNIRRRLRQFDLAGMD